MPASKQPKTQKVCSNCKKDFLSNNRKQIYCSKRCNTYACRTRDPEKYRLQANAHMRRRSPEKRRNQKLRETYGITLADYNNMFVNQDGKCAICFSANVRLVVDHNHKTGTIRNLLCSACNSCVGFCREDVSILNKTAEYIERWKDK